MDSLTHFVLSLAGGYLLAFGLKLRLNAYAVPGLALASLLIDIDHLLVYFKVSNTLILHNIVATMVIAAVLWRLLGKEYASISAVMLLGHLLFDMNSGIYGVPLLYPLSKATYLIPESWEAWLFNDPSYTLVSRTGISLAAYFGLILAFIFLARRLSYRRGA